MSTQKSSKAKSKAVLVRPIAEHKTHESTRPNSAQDQMSEMFEDVQNMIENAGQASVDFMKTMTDSVILTENLFTNIVSGASECANDVINRNAGMSENFLKCSNATDLLSFHHEMFDNNYGMMNKFGINCGDHVNGFTKGLSDIIAYNLANMERFTNKKNVIKG